MTKISMADLRRNFSDDIKALNPDLFAPLGIDSHPALREALAQDAPRASKFGAKKTEIDGKVFDSKAEANRYLELKGKQQRGEISGLGCQWEIILLEGFTYRGEKIRAIKYTADFVYRENGKFIIEDFKSSPTAHTEAFRLRWRLLQWHYRDHPDVICRVEGA